MIPRRDHARRISIGCSLFAFAGATALAGLAACGTDAGDAARETGGSGSGDAAADGAATTGGGTPDGGAMDSASAVPVDAAACGADAKSGDQCETAGALCASPGICCRCLDFPSASGCGELLACAEPGKNHAACPAVAPAEGSPCTPQPGLSCSFCTTDGPSFFGCSLTQAGGDAGAWREREGYSCAD